MRYRRELEGLVTLDAVTIAEVCDDPAAAGPVIERCVEEYITFDDMAEISETDGDRDQADFCRQEAAAWRATARTLRELTRTGRRSSGANSRGVA